MADLKSYSVQELKDYKAELKKEVETEGEIGYKGIKFKHIFYDKDKDLATIYFFEKTKLKDLIDKYSGEKIFKDESQTKKNYMGMDSLSFFQGYFNEYKRHQARLAKIKAELSHRKYGIAPFENIGIPEKGIEKKEHDESLYNELQKKSLKEEPGIIQLAPDKKEFVKTRVSDVLQENKTIVLEKLPKKDRKQNKIWKLTTEQIYIKLFRKDYLKQKATVMRYIKTFRSSDDKKNNSPLKSR